MGKSIGSHFYTMGALVTFSEQIFTDSILEIKKTEVLYYEDDQVTASSVKIVIDKFSLSFDKQTCTYDIEDN